MHRKTVLAISIALLSGSAKLLQGQACTGSPMLGTNSAGNIRIGVSFFDGGKGFGVGGTIGRSFFGSAGFTYFDFDDTTLSLKDIHGGLGYEVATPGSAVSVCPSVGVGYGFGLEVLGVDLTTLSITPAVAAGIIAEVSPAVAAIPFAQAGFLYTRATVDAGPLGEESESDTSGLLILGVGLLFNSRLSIGPSVAIPISEDGGDTVFSVGLTVAIGRSTR